MYAKAFAQMGSSPHSLLNNVNDGQIDERSIRTKGEREYN